MIKLTTIYYRKYGILHTYIIDSTKSNEANIDIYAEYINGLFVGRFYTKAEIDFIIGENSYSEITIEHDNIQEYEY